MKEPILFTTAEFKKKIDAIIDSSAESLKRRIGRSKKRGQHKVYAKSSVL